MRILFGVQGTGNGHISRANAISSELQRYPDVHVDWLISGRSPNKLISLKGAKRYCRGLTFYGDNGSVSYPKTVLNNNLLTYFNDVRQLELRSYDLIVSDYEPIVSWAAQLKSKPVVGIGHQYAFAHRVPMAGDHCLNRLILRRFAPVKKGVGLHWHHFDQPILPPICDLETKSPGHREAHKVLVYLPFEAPSKVLRALTPLHNHEFWVYGPQFKDETLGHIHTRALSREGFKRDLNTTSAAITNTGFEFISECLSLGVKVLTKPVARQVEQLSNAKALSQLGYARVINSINTQECRSFLESSESVRVSYPNVHRCIANALATDTVDRLTESSAALWEQVVVTRA